MRGAEPYWHHDFKPSNAMIVEGGVDDGRVKVLDVGLGRAALPAAPAAIEDAIGGALAQSLTRTVAIMGKPGYMAPEQFEGEPVDERSDQFSFAVSCTSRAPRRLCCGSGSASAGRRARRASGPAKGSTHCR